MHACSRLAWQRSLNIAVRCLTCHSATHVHCGLAFMGSSIVASVGCPDQLASLTLWGGQAAVCMLELSAMLSLAKPSHSLSTHTRAERLRAGRPSTMKTLRAAIVAASLLQSVHAQCVARSGSQWSNHPSMPWAIDEVATAVVNNKL